MNTYKNKGEAKTAAISKYSADYVEFGIVSIHRVSDLMCKTYGIAMEKAGEYFINKEFDELYA